jgi:hypothetical protein
VAAFDFSDLDTSPPPDPPAPPPLPPLPPLTEAQAAGLVAAARRDFDRFPCCDPDTIPLRHRKRRTKHVLQRRCEKWTGCEGCLNYLIEREMTNARHRIGAAVRAGRTIYVGWCWPEQWGARKRQLRREDARLRRPAAQYLKCRDRGEGGRVGYLLISTEPFPGSIVVKPEDALDMLQAALDAFDGDKRPVSTSKGWKLPERHPADEYERDGGRVANCSPDFIDQAARAANYHAEVRMPENADFTSILLWATFTHVSGGEAPQEDEDYLDALLSVGEMFPRGLLEAMRRRADHSHDDGVATEGEVEDEPIAWVDL